MKTVVAALLAGAVLAGGCTPPEDGLAPEDDDVAEIRAARESLGDPMLALAGAVVRSAELIDAIRHQVPRGQAMREAAGGAVGEDTRLADAAQAAADAAAAHAGAGGRVTVAADVVARAAEEALVAAAALAEEAEMLEALAGIDVELEAVVREWDVAGAQAERRAALGDQAELAGTLADRARQVEPTPAACTRLRDNRVRWAELVAERTRRLADAATAQDGATYDELRAAYQRAPFGEERVDADAADATCWQAASPVAQAMGSLDQLVEALERALNP